jgi:polar amino acid transport system substrate-binding protein
VKDAKQMTFAQTSEVFAAMRSNRGVAFAQDDTLLAELASKNADTEVVGEQKAGSPWGMGIRKGDKAMATWVNAAIEKMRAEDFFWKAFQKTVTDKGVQQQFQEFVPRPGSGLEYPTGEIIQVPGYAGSARTDHDGVPAVTGGAGGADQAGHRQPA